MSSSSSSDSEVDARKKVASSDSDSENEKVKKSKRRPARSLAKPSIIESGSDSDSDDGSDNKASSSRKRKQEPKKSVPAKKRKSRKSESGSDDGIGELVLSAEDRKRLATLSEKEREQEIYRLTEEMENRRAREQIKQKLAAKSGDKRRMRSSSSSQSDSDGGARRKTKGGARSDSDSDEEEKPKAKPAKKAGKASPQRGSDSEGDVQFQRPSEMERKKQQKSALSDLLNKRKEKEKKEAKKAALAVDAVFGKDRGSDSDSSSSSSASSRSSSPSSVSSRARSPSPDEEEQPKKEVETRKELGKARLSRFRMAKFVHAPFFRKAVIGCYVRVGGLPPTPHMKSASNSKIAQILDVVETAKTYSVEGQRTNKGLKLRIGGKDERVIRLEFISNQDFNEAEFNEWITSLRHCNASLPTLDVIEKKEKDIKEASNHVYTDAEVESIVSEKKRFEVKTTNFAARKRLLLTEKERAEQMSDHVKVAELTRQIQEVDGQAEKLDRHRQGAIVGVTWINKRNRQQMKDALLGAKTVVDITMHDDPFTRKSGRMKPVSGTANAVKQDKTPGTPGTPATPGSTAGTPGGVLSTPQGLNTPVMSTLGTPKGGLDLFQMHNVDVDLNDLDLGFLPEKTATNPHADFSSTHSHATSSEPRGRPMSLEDYKRRKQLQKGN